jgi:predicted enzyme related to lactoylglutathione lyase
MVTVNSFPQGTPIWVDLQSTNAAEAAAFYRALLGWDVSEPTERSGGYRLAFIGGVPVCAIGSLPPALAEKGAIPTWTTYLSVEDVDAAAAAIPDAGGTVLLPPGELGTGVRLSMATDATGAVVGLWQGAGANASWLRHEPGAVDWFELLTDDVDGAVGFYEAVLGTSVSHMKLGESDYQMLTSAGGEFAGVAASDVSGLPSHWRVYFGVADLAESVKLVKKLGGRALTKPASAVGVGSWAAVADPQGAVFSLLQAEQRTADES